MRGAIILAASGMVLAGNAAVALAQAGAGVSPRTAEVLGQTTPPSAGQPPARPPMPPPLTVSDRPGAGGSEVLYIEKCGMCHGPNGMGTGLLGRTREVALLEARDDLAAAYVSVAVRQGIGNMPAIARGEVSDEQLRAIAAYLAAGPHGEPAR